MDADQAVSGLLRDHGDRLLRVAYQLCHDRSTAEDLVQQALERIYRSWRADTAVDQPLAYARRVVVNEFLRRRRLRSADEVVSEALPETAVVAHDDAVVARDELWRALGTLAPRQRAAVVLRYYEDLPDAEIAHLLGCRETTVRSLVARGLQALRALDAAAATEAGRL